LLRGRPGAAKGTQGASSYSNATAGQSARHPDHAVARRLRRRGASARSPAPIRVPHRALPACCRRPAQSPAGRHRARPPGPPPRPRARPP